MGRRHNSVLERHPAATLVAVLSLGWLAGLFFVWPFPTTVHAMLSLVVALLTWTALQWAALLQYAGQYLLSRRYHHSSSNSEHSKPLLGNDMSTPSPTRWNWLPSEWSRARRLAVLAASILSIAIITHSLPPTEASTPLPILHRSDPLVPERYLIAANLYNNEEVFGEWSAELVRLCQNREHIMCSCISSKV